MNLLELACRHAFPRGLEIDASFDLDRPATSLFGPSGSGKTSLLMVIAGFLRPDAGFVRLGGRVLLDTARRLCVPPEHRRIGVVFQDHLLFPHLTVGGNLRYGRRTSGRNIDLSRAVEVLELGPLLDRYPRNLSGGERQRVALARALASGPEFLLMDEPLTALDAALKDRILSYLERVIAEWRIPVLFVSHAQAEVRRLAEWVVVLDRGHVVAAASPEEALACPETLAWKDSLAPFNLLRVTDLAHAEGHFAGAIGSQRIHLSLDRPPARDSLYVAFSPTDVTLSRREVSGLSARNCLRGPIRQIVAVPAGVFVAVDVGQIVWAEITPEAAAELALSVGDEVTCYLKAHSLRAVE
jgi:molybdate transport system ATP-binding protein